MLPSQDGSFTSIPYRAYTASQEDSELSSLLDDDDPQVFLRACEEREHTEKSLLRKLDARMSILILIYILNYIDRNNAAAARLRGFEEDLGLKGQQFNTILSILYVGYIIMQVPSNMLLDYMGRPSIYMPICMVIWGLISVMTGFTTNFMGALITRFFLGFIEAAFFPGALFLLSKWYKRRELGQRMAYLTCGNLISSAFGSLLASAILDVMDGCLGYAAWRWLFYIEGSLTVLVALASIFILPDFPNMPHSWLTPAESALALQRMEEDSYTAQSNSSTTLLDKSKSYGAVALALSDWRVWWMALALTSMVVSLSFNAFFPTLAATMGYNPTITLLLCVPPWVFATFEAFVVSRHSDKSGKRFVYIALSLLLGILGFLLAMSTMNIVARYISLFLMAQSYSGFIVFITWVSNTIHSPTSKRAVALAFINAVSSLGNVAGSYVWPVWWGPSYWYSFAICIVGHSVCIWMSWVLKRHLEEVNRKAEEEEEEEETLVQVKGFRYLL